MWSQLAIDSYALLTLSSVVAFLYGDPGHLALHSSVKGVAREQKDIRSTREPGIGIVTVSEFVSDIH